MPLSVRVLYGGITEEVLLRWGFMTVVAWLAWRFSRRTPAWMWVAIVVSAVVFAAGHLPAASFLVGPLTAPVVAYVLVANTVFGVVFGWLYWRYGLEAAMVAHVLTHVVSYFISG
jgi:membrane protease YdiL (CAAX protease family)